VEIRTKKHFNEILQQLTLEIVEEDELDEITVTGDVDGYSTPMAFTAGAGKKKKKKIATNSTGFSVVKEELDSKDIGAIRKMIRDVVADILRDIWIKRSTWK